MALFLGWNQVCSNVSFIVNEPVTRIRGLGFHVSRKKNERMGCILKPTNYFFLDTVKLPALAFIPVDTVINAYLSSVVTTPFPH